ncbi:MAG: hypothetical protein KGH54_02150, partial [Candidatus Micrarchaeota archaeon]|nr:hypothetical protein [Candidatus Micrarchaeota archaeon]
MPRKKATGKVKRGPMAKPIPLWPFTLLLVALIAFYSIQNSILVGIAAFVMFIIIIVLVLKEVKEEVEENGSK